MSVSHQQDQVVSAFLKFKRPWTEVPQGVTVSSQMLEILQAVHAGSRWSLFSSKQARRGRSAYSIVESCRYRSPDSNVFSNWNGCEALVGLFKLGGDSDT